MSQYLDLVQAFQSKGYTLSFEDNIFLIENSTDLSNKIQKVVKELVLSMKYGYISSDNRISGKIAFTIMPYTKPLSFDKVELKDIKLSKQELTASINSTPSRVTQSMIAFQNHISLLPSCTTHLMVEFVEGKTQTGHCLDIGCGTGINSSYLYKKGWKVTAIDRNQVVLDVLLKNVTQMNKDRVSAGTLNIVCKDLHEFDFTPNTFDLVVIANVLNYIEPKTLVELMKKIHNTIKSNGIIIGNLCYEDKNIRHEIVECNKSIGVHFYQKEVAAALLAHSGFDIIECRLQHEDGVEPFLIEFSAQKKVLPNKEIISVSTQQPIQLLEDDRSHSGCFSGILSCLRPGSKVTPHVAEHL